MAKIKAKDLPRTIFTFCGTRRIEHGTKRTSYSVLNVGWHCECGFAHYERRTQNALARKSKLEGVYNQHMRAMHELAQKQGCPQ